MFAISEAPIDIPHERSRLANPHAGALVAFEGLVRNHNEGQAVRSLEYEAFAEMALREGEVIGAEAKSRFAIDDIRMVHRVGHLQLEECAVWVGVTAAHRDAAFKACRYAIDQLKQRLPIWKREHYVSGGAQWVNCQHCAHSHDEVPKEWEPRLYERQTRLAEIGLEGQQRLKQSRVAVVGAGALACGALPYLVAAGVGYIRLFDDDRVELSNLHRQTLYTVAEQGDFKVHAAQRRLQQQNPFVTVEARSERIDVATLDTAVADCNVIIDCTDNFRTKYLLHDYAFFNRKALVQASIFQFEAQMHVYTDFTRGCLRCLWPDEPAPECIGTCAEVGVLGSTAGIMGALQAQETIKVILGLASLADHEMLVMDLLNLRQEKLTKPHAANCPLCGETPKMSDWRERPAIARPPQSEGELALVDVLRELDQWTMVDIRSYGERDPESPVQAAMLHIPCEQVESLTSLASDRNYLLVCQSGVRSRRTLKSLRAQGLNHFFALTDGMPRLEDELRT
jgi:adenylyltransferase/sulfurtransferase